ncbi:hypothetical protein DEO27_007840 [Mucilaginibacter rubeus]|uniref:Uncharacterized protein n=1 Tax=Mucilaginibacter rubeus TaxID=2027860 RepID=A0A5C1HVP0_9SPHI|nr:hypothetical protein DEO27_007840 [Mucilaginibacter rubeus]
MSKNDYQLVRKQKITPETAVNLLKSYGTEITLDEARIILVIMYKFAKLSIEQQKKLITGNKQDLEI